MALAVEEPRAAVIWAVWTVAVGDAVATKEIDVAAPAIVTEAGTERAGFALEIRMIAPPAGAGPERVIVHASPLVAATHCKAEMLTSVKTAPLRETAIDDPVGDAATALGIATETLDTPGELNETVPTTPLEMMFEFRPVARQV